MIARIANAQKSGLSSSPVPSRGPIDLGVEYKDMTLTRGGDVTLDGPVTMPIDPIDPMESTHS